jgi:regulatory protein
MQLQYEHRQVRRTTSRSRKAAAVGPLDAGLNLLSRRAHSQAEIRRKLGRRGYGEEEVESTVTRLVELGYLDDRAFAEGHVRRRSSGLGRLAISAELAARGVDRAVADEALGRLDADAQLASATRLAERLFGRKAFPGYREMLNSVGPKLMRRGFSPGVVRSACLAVWDGTLRDGEA